MLIVIAILLVLILWQITRIGHQICRNQVAQANQQATQLGKLIEEAKR